MSNNQQKMEAALRQEWGVSVQTFATNVDLAAAATRLLKALGVDPAGTTEPQSERLTLTQMLAAAEARHVETMRERNEEIATRAALVGHVNDAAAMLNELRAEVERLRARVAELQAAGDALAKHHYDFVDLWEGQEHRCVERWRAAVRGDDLDPQPEEDER